MIRPIGLLHSSILPGVNPFRFGTASRQAVRAAAEAIERFTGLVLEDEGRGLDPGLPFADPREEPIADGHPLSGFVGARRRRFAWAIEHDGDLVSAPSRPHVARTNATGQPMAELAQH